MPKQKLQLNVNDKVINIISQLSRNDKARFVEFAIENAYKSEEIKKYFSWNDDLVPKSSEGLGVEIDHSSENNMNPIEKQPKIDKRW